MAGPVTSGLSALIEFSFPGVPPLTSSEAAQLSSSPQGLLGSINSSDQPPSFFISSRYQRSVNFTESIVRPAAFFSITTSPALFSDGNVLVPSTVPYQAKFVAAAEE